MNRVSVFQSSRFRWWLLAAVAVLVLGQALMSGHIHADTLDSADCYVCLHGDDQGKKLSQAAPHYLVKPQRFSYTLAQPTALVHGPLTAAPIRAPPVSLQF